MAKVAASSFADDTSKPVLIRFWTVLSSEVVLLRFCRAANAPALVLTEKAILLLLFGVLIELFAR